MNGELWREGRYESRARWNRWSQSGMRQDPESPNENRILANRGSSRSWSTLVNNVSLGSRTCTNTICRSDESLPEFADNKITTHSLFRMVAPPVIWVFGLCICRLYDVLVSIRRLLYIRIFKFLLPQFCHLTTWMPATSSSQNSNKPHRLSATCASV